METSSLAEYRRFTTSVREHGGHWYLHIPKDLASAWGLQKGAPIEIAVIRTYPKPEKKAEKK